MARICLMPFLGLALAISACGGEDEGRPSGAGASAAALDNCRAADGYEFQTIMDFEPNDPEARISCDPNLGAMCSYYFNYDLVHSVNVPDLQQTIAPGAYDCQRAVVPGQAISNPEATEGTFYSEPIGDGRCMAPSSGLHITAQNIGMCYGSNGRLGWGASLDVTFAPVLDASAWDGIGLWVRRGAGPSGDAIIMSVVDPFTSGAEDPNTLEAYCNATEPAPGTPPVPDSDKCDAFGTVITLTQEWTFVPAIFSAMRQKGFGVRSPLGIVDQARINRLQILMTAGNWDIWIDDVALFRKPQ